MATAMDNYAPFDSGPGSNVTEDGWRAMMRRGNISGVMRNQASEMLTFGDSTGMQCKISAGEVMIESHWGQLTATKAQAIGANSSGNTRLDLVVARADWVANQVQYDVIAGTPSATPVVPALTRNTSKWEIPLAVVKVVNGAATINAADVTDARQWGGPPVATVSDDYLLYQDKISSCPRNNVSGAAAVTNGQLYVARMHSLGEPTCSQIRLCPAVLPVGGSTTVRIFRGARPDQLTTFIDPTTSNFLYGGSVDTVHSSAITPTTFRAGETIVIAVYGTGTTTAANLINNAVTWSGGNSNTFLNIQSVNVTTAFKAVGAMPSSLNLLDGSWSLRDRVFWAALA